MGSSTDLHMHTVASDGTDYPESFLQKIKDAGIRTFSVTDHDTIDGALQVRDLAPEKSGITFFMGIEFTCRTSIGEVHLLGYGFDPENRIFQAALEKGKRLRREKLEKRLHYLKEQGIRITDTEIDAFYRMKSCGKPHLATMLVQKGYAKNMNDAIRLYLNPCDTSDLKITSTEAIGAINESGGIPVWAHPLGEGFHRRRNGERFQTMEQCYAQLQELLRQGIRGMECYYSQYGSAQIQNLLQAAEGYHLLVSGGSDYHGENRDVVPGTLNAAGKPVDDDCLTVLRELKERQSSGTAAEEDEREADEL